GVAAAGAAVAGTAVAISSHNDNSTTTTPAANTTTTTAPPATTVTTTSTTTTLPRTNRAPNAVLTTVPDPPQGTSPLTVRFDMCASSDPDGDALTFVFLFGDGTSTTAGPCAQDHTYTATSIRG